MEDQIYTKILGLGLRRPGTSTHPQSQSQSHPHPPPQDPQNEKIGPIDERPRSVYEIVTRRMLEEVREDVSEIKSRVNALLWLILGTLAVEFVMRLVR
jgi:hypothetical protein